MRATFDTDATSEDSLELIEYEDTTGMPSFEFRFDFEGQKDYLSFFFTRDDLKELVKQIIDKT